MTDSGPGEAESQDVPLDLQRNDALELDPELTILRGRELLEFADLCDVGEVCRRRYEGPMDGGPQAAQSVYVHVIDVVRPSERDQLIIGTITELACRPAAPTDSPSSSTTVPTKQELTGESKATSGLAVNAPVNGSLEDASVNRLACLFRHWTWANEVMAQFERELADGWVYDEDPLSDHPFGAYYHWCALLCSFSEAALEHGLLSRWQLDALRPDLEASLPALRACRQLLVVIPASLEEHPRMVNLLRNDQTLGRLRRIHYAFGEALREEQMSRELDWLLYEH